MSAGARQFGKLKKRAVRWLKRRRTGAVRRAKRWQRQKSRWQRAQTKRLTAAWRRRKGPLKTRWKRLNRKTNYWPQVVWLSLENFAAHQGLTMASVIAFSAFISLFPLALLILSLANSVLPPTEALAQWTTFLNVITPGGADIWRVNTPFLTNRRLAVQIGSVVVLLWTGSSVLAVISRTLDRAWQVEHRVHKIILLRMRAVPLALLAAALLALTFAASSGLRLAPFINRAGELHLLLRGGLGLLLVAADVAIFWGIYWAVPSVALRWRQVWPGAVAAAPLWSLSKWGLNWYLGRLLLFRVVYGSLTAVVIFLIWAYISGVILLFGAEFSASLYAHHHPPEAVQSRGGLKPRRTAKQG